MNNSKITNIREEIEHNLGFLFDMGYNFHHFKKLPMGDWEVILESVENTIVIYSDHGEIDLAFAPKDSNKENQIGIKAMIYYLTNGRIFVGEYPKNLFNNRKRRFEQLANLLKEYINQIRPFFGKDFDKYKHELILTRRKYNNISIDKFINSNK